MSWGALHTTAGRQHGVVSRACARDAGLSPSTVAARAGREGDRVTTRRYRELPDGDVTEVDGLEVVTPVRLLRELAGMADESALTNLAIDVRLRRRAALSEATALLQRDRRFRGRAQLRRIVAPLSDDGSDSGFEHRLVSRLREAGLHPDGQQGEVETRDGVRRLDVVWSALGVAVECVLASRAATRAS